MLSSLIVKALVGKQELQCCWQKNSRVISSHFYWWLGMLVVAPKPQILTCAETSNVVINDCINICSTVVSKSLCCKNEEAVDKQCSDLTWSHCSIGPHELLLEVWCWSIIHLLWKQRYSFSFLPMFLSELFWHLPIYSHLTKSWHGSIWLCGSDSLHKKTHHLYPLHGLVCFGKPPVLWYPAPVVMSWVRHWKKALNKEVIK